jgi:hypothetical protein
MFETVQIPPHTLGYGYWIQIGNSLIRFGG